MELQTPTRLSALTITMTKLQNTAQICKPDHESGPSLGNYTSYSSIPVNKGTQRTEKEISKIRHDFKKQKVELKKKIGEKVPRVSYCGTRLISKYTSFIEMVEGESGGIYYRGMQRCGSVHFCPDCMYKLMKGRADELYNQLQAFKNTDKVVLFLTFTLQHHLVNSLRDLHKVLLDAFNFANKHRAWQKAKKSVPVEYLRTLEVLYGSNGWHPHLHCVFVGDPEIIETINIFVNLYKQYLSARGLVVNKHTVVIDKWNGKLDDMKDYMFKGMLEQELTSGGLKKSGEGSTFFELVEAGNDQAVDEYIEAIKGKRQYHHSREFFKDVRQKSDEEIIQDDSVDKVLFVMTREQYSEIHYKGIALHLLNEYEYGGKSRMIKLLELYDCDTSFIDSG